MSRPSNLERAVWRIKCRDKLVAHIESQLGLTIDDPKQVRFQPGDQDGYRWSWLPEIAHLFKKPLSKHTKNAYKKLYKEVGKSFWAVAPHDIDPGSNSTAPSFSLAIDPEIRENTRTEEELRQWQEKAKEEGEARQRLEAKCQDMHLSLSTAQEEVSRLRSENSRLHQKIRRSRLRTNEAAQIWARISQYDENSEDENIANAID